MVIIAETERLIIRNWIPDEDAPDALFIYSNPEVTQFLITKVDSIENACKLLQRWLKVAQELNNGTGLWAIVLKKTREIVGTIILIPLREEDGKWTEKYEIGWHLKRSAWGHGYATEAAKAILNYGFNTLKLSSIYSIVNSENINSIRVIQRLGMIPVGNTSKFTKVVLSIKTNKISLQKQAIN